MALAEYTPQPHKFNRLNKNGLFGRDSYGMTLAEIDLPPAQE
jgi:hypothetical protein